MFTVLSVTAPLSNVRHLHFGKMEGSDHFERGNVNCEGLCGLNPIKNGRTWQPF